MAARVGQSILVREYVDADRAAVVVLTEALQDYLEGIDPLNRLIRVAEYGEWYTSRMLHEVARQSGRIYVAAEGATLVGYIAGVVDIESPDMGKGYVTTKAGRISELVVAPNKRSSGIGQQLMAMLEQFFREAACDVIRVEVFAPNGGAKRFYERLGYGVRTYDLVKLVDLGV